MIATMACDEDLLHMPAEGGVTFGCALPPKEKK
jgi:hypothetical protein